MKDHLIAGQENQNNFNQSQSGFQINQQQQPPAPVASPGAENSSPESKFNTDKFVNEIQVSPPRRHWIWSFFSFRSNFLQIEIIERRHPERSTSKVVMIEFFMLYFSSKISKEIINKHSLRISKKEIKFSEIISLSWRIFSPWTRHRWTGRFISALALNGKVRTGSLHTSSSFFSSAQQKRRWKMEKIAPLRIRRRKEYEQGRS